MTAPSLLAALAGAALILVILWDAFETVLVPRRIGRRVRLTRYFYVLTWRGWRALALAVRRPSRREALLGVYGPLSLILLLVIWASGLIAGFALLQITALDAASMTPKDAAVLLYMSGETFFTLGFGDVTPATVFGRLLSVLESGMGFGFLGTVIGYLPTMYAGFAQREIEISLLDARAGSPPTAAEFLRRRSAAEAAAAGDAVLREWERWSAHLLETHISYPQLAYYRSQHLNQSWLAALTAILDSTSVLLAREGGAAPPQAKRTFAMARHALVDITQIFVARYVPAATDRLPPETLARLRAHLEDSPMRLPDAPEFVERLAELRRLYEPYAQALGARLLFELPPWIHSAAIRDNWRGGPWDKTIAALPGPEHRSEDHF